MQQTENISCLHWSTLAANLLLLHFTHICAAKKSLTCAVDAVVQPWLHSRAEQSRADFNSSHVDQYYVSYFPFPIWRDESMHDLIVNVAKCAADAVAHSGRSIRMGQHVMIRVDIALTHQGPLVRQFVLHLCVHPHVRILHATQLKPGCKMGMHDDVRAKSALTCWFALVATTHCSTSFCS